MRRRRWKTVPGVVAVWLVVVVIGFVSLVPRRRRHGCRWMGEEEAGGKENVEAEQVKETMKMRVVREKG